MPIIFLDNKPEIVRVALSTIVLIRTNNAGVHFGTMVKQQGEQVTLVNARRLWSWVGACSLSQVAVDGVNLAKSKISVSVPKITLFGVNEIITMTKKAGDSMMGAEPWKS
jgi:hypothetical protein